MSKAEQKNQTEKKDKKEKSDKKHKEKKEKREGEPKKPQTAYFLFCADKRKENPEKKYAAKELGEMYANLPEGEKNKYKKMADDAHQKYEEELALFNKNHPEEEKDSQNKRKAKPSKSDQKKNGKKACNCGSCDECKKKNKKDDDE